MLTIMIGLFIGGAASSSNHFFLEDDYQNVISSLYGIGRPLPILSTAKQDIKAIPSDEYIDVRARIQDILRRIELIIFSDMDLVKIELVEKLNTSAEYDLSTNTIYISSALIAKVQSEYSKSEEEIFTFIIAHELAHFLMTNFCSQNINHRTPRDNICSNHIPKSNEDPWFMYYEFIQAYSQEHLEIDFIAYTIMEKMNVSAKAVYNFLNDSPVPWGESKRITDALQTERLERIRLAKQAK